MNWFSIWSNNSYLDVVEQMNQDNLQVGMQQGDTPEEGIHQVQGGMQQGDTPEEDTHIEEGIHQVQGGKAVVGMPQAVEDTLLADIQGNHVHVILCRRCLPHHAYPSLLPFSSLQVAGTMGKTRGESNKKRKRRKKEIVAVGHWNCTCIHDI